MASPPHFPHVKPEFLAWKQRKHTLLNEIRHLVAAPTLGRSPLSSQPELDVLCCQELTNYWECFAAEMRQLGYASVYVKRPSLHATSWSGMDKEDGCGIFFRDDRFVLIKERSINFKDEHDRVALMVLLEHRTEQLEGRSEDTQHEEERELILVVTSHLYWDPSRVEDQLKELREVEEGIEKMKSFAERKYKLKRLPIIFCGDFNNTPRSPIYRFMRQEISLGEKEQKGMRSAYENYGLLQKEKGLIQMGSEQFSGEEGALEPAHTTVTSRRCHTIDYIWYSPMHFLPRFLLEVPEEEALRKEDGPELWVERENERIVQDAKKKGKDPAEAVFKSGCNYNGLPNSAFGSDHIPLLAIFELLQ